MAVYIAHSSIDENGKIAGGKAGDQTGKEVCIRTWYNKNWQYVLRINNEKVRKQFANNMIDVANNENVGYDQNQRNTLLKQAEGVNFDFTRISTPCECDCSSLVTICVLGAIYKVLGVEQYQRAKDILITNGNCATTRNLRSKFGRVTVFSVNTYNSSLYTSSCNSAVFGDIYLREGSHVIVCVMDGAKQSIETPTSTSKKNEKVLEWQKAAIADGFNFPKYGADGEWGGECETVAKKAIVKKRDTWKYNNLTRIVQKALGVHVDGKCGINTQNAIFKFQREKGLAQDGCVGLNTWKKILGI